MHHNPHYSHPLPDAPYRNIFAVDLVTKTRNIYGLWSLSSSYSFSHHSPQWSQNKYIYHLLNLTLHLGKCWILMWDVLSTAAWHGPLGLHSGSQKTRGGWFKTTPVLRNVVEQPPLLTDYLCLTAGQWRIVGGTMLSCDIFLSPLTEMFTSQLCLMWGKQSPAHRTGFQFNQLMEKELFIPLSPAFHHLRFPAAKHSLRQSLYQML